MGITQSMVKENLNIEKIEGGRAYRIYMFKDGTFANKDNFEKAWQVKVRDGEERDADIITSVLAEMADRYFSVGKILDL